MRLAKTRIDAARFWNHVPLADAALPTKYGPKFLERTTRQAARGPTADEEATVRGSSPFGRTLSRAGPTTRQAMPAPEAGPSRYPHFLRVSAFVFASGPSAFGKRSFHSHGLVASISSREL